MNNDGRRQVMIISKFGDDIDKMVIGKRQVKATSLRKIKAHRFKLMTLKDPLKTAALKLLEDTLQYAEVLNKDGSIEAYPLAVQLHDSMVSVAEEVDNYGRV